MPLRYDADGGFTLDRRPRGHYYAGCWSPMRTSKHMTSKKPAPHRRQPSTGQLPM